MPPFTRARTLVISTGEKDGGDCAVDVAGVFPFFLIFKEVLLDLFAFAEMRGGARVLGGYFGVRVHRQREIAVDQVDLAGADVVVHELAIGGGVQGFAGRALEVAEDFEDQRGAFGAEGFVGVDIGGGAGILRRSGHGHEDYANAKRAQDAEECQGGFA